MSEAWVSKSVYCPYCGQGLEKYRNNKPVADFCCGYCDQQYELKSKRDYIGNKIIDGAYSTMIRRLSESTNPNLFVLAYSENTLDIVDFVAIPRYFFTNSIIEKRDPLGENARRAGWEGCTVLYGKIPDLGKVYYIEKGKIKTKFSVLENWKRTLFLSETKDQDTKGWLVDILRCIEDLRKPIFSLGELYSYISTMRAKHPNNYNIEAKVRQQLQLLRDKNVIDFIGRGMYKIRSSYAQIDNR